MTQKFAVIGLGGFGVAIVHELICHGKKVIAIDKNPERIKRLRNDAISAICIDATDEKTLVKHNIHEVDIAIIAIRHDFEAVLLMSIELVQLKVKRLMAQAENLTQQRLLLHLGVSEAFIPEEAMAKYVIQRLLHNRTPDFLACSRACP